MDEVEENVQNTTDTVNESSSQSADDSNQPVMTYHDNMSDNAAGTAVGGQATNDSSKPVNDVPEGSRPMQRPMNGQPMQRPMNGAQPGAVNGQPMQRPMNGAQPRPVNGQPMQRPMNGAQPRPVNGQPMQRPMNGAQPRPVNGQPMQRPMNGAQPGAVNGQPMQRPMNGAQPRPVNGQPMQRPMNGTPQQPINTQSKNDSDASSKDAVTNKQPVNSPQATETTGDVNRAPGGVAPVNSGKQNGSMAPVNGPQGPVGMTPVNGPQGPIGMAPVNSQQNTSSMAPVDDQPTQAQKKPMSGKMIGIICGSVAALLIVAIIVVAVSLHRTTVNLDDYIIFDAEGYDGYGEASVSFDEDALRNDYAKLKYTSDGKKYMKEVFGSSYEDYSAVEALIDYIYISVYSLDQAEYLSNGDTVTMDMEYNISEYSVESIEEIIKCELEFSDTLEFTVEGLNAVASKDFFSGIDVEFSGTAPNATARVIGNDDYGLDYTLDKSTGLSVGDTVTVTLTGGYGDLTEYCIENYGATPDVTTKEFTVEGVASYITKHDDIPDEMMEKMQSQAKDVVDSYVANSWDVELTRCEYIGDYFLVQKDFDSYGSANMISLVYKLEAKISIDVEVESEAEDTEAGDAEPETTVETKTYYVSDYYYVNFYNLIILPDGSYSVDLSDYSTPGASFEYDTGISSGWFSTYEYRFYGYELLDSLKSDIVTKNVDSYNYEENIQDVTFESETTEETTETPAEQGSDATPTDAG